MDIEDSTIGYFEKLFSKEPLAIDQEFVDQLYQCSKIFTKKYEEENKLYIFVIMPFGDDELTKNFERYIKKPLEEEGHSIERVDDSIRATSIIRDIIERIRNADVIIAELTLDNMNVYYELGRAHEIEKNVIQICQQEQEHLPFDIRGVRTIKYKNSKEGYEKLFRKVRKFINKI
jgi:hypothetical protein